MTETAAHQSTKECQARGGKSLEDCDTFVISFVTSIFHFHVKSCINFSFEVLFSRNF